MKITAKIWILSFLVLITGFATQRVEAFSERQTENGYYIFTHVIIGSNAPGTGTPLSKDVSAELNSFRTDFGFSTYTLAATHFQTLGNGGSINFQSMALRLGSVETMENPIFLELSFSRFNVEKEDAGFVGFRAFNFHARLPVRYKGIEKNPENVSLVKYENIKISLSNIPLQLDKPKLIASIPLPDHGETLFFIVEVRKADAQ